MYGHGFQLFLATLRFKEGLKGLKKGPELSSFANFVIYWNALGPHLCSLIHNALQCFSEAPIKYTHVYFYWFWFL